MSLGRSKWCRMQWKLLLSSVPAGNQIHVDISRIWWLALCKQNGLCCIFWACWICVFKNKLRLIQKVQEHGTRDLSFPIHFFWGLLGRKAYWIPFKIPVSLKESSSTVNIIINSDYIYDKNLLSLCFYLDFNVLMYFICPEMCFPHLLFSDQQIHS